MGILEWFRRRRQPSSEMGAHTLPALFEPLEPRLLLDGALLDFCAVRPLGSLIHQTNVIEHITEAEQNDHFTIDLDAGQTVTLLAQPADSSLDVSLSVVDPSSALIATSDSNGPGENELIQTVDAAMSGTYMIDVITVAGTGEYRLSLYLNAALEAERLGDLSNDTPATAQDIDGSFIDLDDGAGRAAVVGSLGSAAVETFESGLLGANWTTYTSSPDGRVEVTGGNAAGGRYALWMDMPLDSDAGSSVLTEAVWTVDLSGMTGAQLQFQHTDYMEDDSPFDGSFTGHFNADGIAISNDGVNWHPVFDFTIEENWWSFYTVDLGAEAADAGIALGSNFQIKFQRYGPHIDGAHGLGWDDIRITESGASDTDYYSVDLAGGDRLAAAVSNLTTGRLQLDLYDATGTLRAEGVINAAETASEYIRDFAAPAAGTYLLRVSGDIATEYSLLLARNMGFDVGPNDTDATRAWDITQTGSGLGYSVAGTDGLITLDSDIYPNHLVKLDSADGTVLGTLDSSVRGGPYGLTLGPDAIYLGADEHDGTRWFASLFELDAQTGEILKRIPDLDFDFRALAYFNGELFVLASESQGKITVLDPQNLRLKRTFDTGLDLYTLTGSRIGLLGTAPRDLYRIDPFTGASTLMMKGSSSVYGYKGAAAIGDELFLAYTDSMQVYDLGTLSWVREWAVDSYYRGLGTDPGDMDYFAVSVAAGDTLSVSTTTPSAGLGDNTFDPMVELYGPDGALVASDDNGADDGRNAQLSYLADSGGTYVVRVLGAAGEGAYVLNVSGQTAEATELADLKAVSPIESLIYEGSLSGTLNFLGDAKDFTISLEAGQTLAVALEADEGVTVAVEVLDPLGVSLGSSGSSGPGGSVTVGPVASSSGTYTIRITSDGTGPGEFTGTVLLNAAVEGEQYDGPANNTQSDAQDIDGSFIDLGDGVRRAGVVGSTVGEQHILFADDFETGELGPAWSTYSYDEDSTISLTTYETGEHNWVLQIYAGGSGFVSKLNEAIWTVNLSGAVDARLNFQLWESAHHNVFDGDFVGHYDASGVAISADGVNWHPIFDITGQNGLWQQHSVDLSGVPYGSQFHIKFQHYGTYSGHRLKWDDISITTAAEDWYSFSAEAGERVSVAAEAVGPEQVEIQLYDASGALVAGGLAGGSSIDTAIQYVHVPTGGRYYVRVTSHDDAKYSMWVVKGAAIDTASNNTLTPAQDITDSGKVFGAVGRSMGRFFAIDRKADTDVIIEFDPYTGQVVNTLPLTDGFASGRVSLATTPDNLLVARNYRNYILELNPNTGETIRTIDIPSQLDICGMAYLDGEIFVLEGYDTIHVYDYETGAVLRTLSSESWGNWGLGLAASSTALYHLAFKPNGTSSLYRIDITDGSATVVGELGFTSNDKGLAIVGNRAFVQHTMSGTSKARVYAVDLDTCRILWTFETDPGQLQNDDMGGDGSSEPGPDRYAVQVNAGDELNIVTSTPFGGAGNDLDPRINLYDPSGALVADDDNSAGGVNALLTHTATETGAYLIEVVAAASEGQYILSVTGQTGVIPTFEVVSTDIANGATLVAPPSQITVNFSGDAQADSLDVGDLRVDGLSPTALTVLDADTAVFDLPILREGSHVVEILPGAFTDTSDVPVDHFVSVFTVDLNPPHVIDSSIQENDILPRGALTVTIQFDSPLDTTSLDESAFSLVGIWEGVISPDAWQYDSASSTLTIQYSRVPRDYYRLTVYSGDGLFEGLDGGDLDGETSVWPVGPNVSGDGIEGGNFTVNFLCEGPMIITPTEFTPVKPFGSLVYETTVDGQVSAPGQAEVISLDLDAAQTITVLVEPASGLRPTIKIRGPAGGVIASVVAGEAGATALLQTVAADSAGTYTLTIGGQANTTGEFTAQIVLNAALDEELGDGSLGSAQDINAGFIDLGTGAGRAAVIGLLPGTSGEPVVTEDFAGGSLGDAWSTYSTYEVGRIQLTQEYGAATGTFAMVMDREGDGHYNINEAIWAVDLSGLSTATLHFSHADLGDEEHAFTDEFMGHYDADGIAISDDGIHWHPIWNAPDQPIGFWMAYSVDLADEAKAAGITLGPDLLIKFQQYGNYHLPYDGRGWDGLVITTTDHVSDSTALYSFSLTEGDIVSLVARTGGARAGLELLDSAGTVMARGMPDPDGGAARIDNIAAPATDAYYVRVIPEIGAGGAEYSLVITRNAGFDADGNDSPADAQDITPTGDVLGSVGLTPMDRLFVFQKNNQLYELDPGTGEILRAMSNPGAKQPSFASVTTTTNSILFSVRTGSYPSENRLYEVDPESMEVVREFYSNGYEIAFWGDEIFIRSRVWPDQVDVLDYASLEVRRNFKLDPSVSLFSLPWGLGAIEGGSIYQVDWWTGQQTLLGTVDVPYQTTTAGVIGDELFVTSVNTSEETSEMRVYDLATLAYKRTLSPGDPQRYDDVGAGVGGIDSDYYSFVADIGDAVTITTMTPAGGPFDLANDLDPAIELYDITGALVAYDDDSAADGRNARLTYAVTEGGRYTVRVLSANGLRGEYLLSVDGYTGLPGAFTILASDPVDGVRLDEVPTHVTIDFSDSVLLSSLAVSDLTINGAPAIGLAAADSDTVVFELSPQGMGVFDLNIAAGSILDYLGRPVEGFGSQIIIPAHFVTPAGSMIYTHTTTGGITEPGQMQTFTLQLDGSQTVTVAVEPSVSLQPTIELRDPSGNVIGEASSPDPGRGAFVQTAPVAVPGDYTVTIGGAGDSLGDYAARILLNAAAETEPLDGVDNGSIGSAQNIEDSFMHLAGDGWRGAVIGMIEGDSRISVVSEDFESGALGPAWDTHISGEGADKGARILITGDYGAAGGDSALIMQGPEAAESANTYAVWTVDLSGLAEAKLTFAHADFGDAEDTFGGSFVSFPAADGIAISQDGSRWYPIFDAPDQAFGQWMQYEIDLFAAAEAADISIGSGFQILFQASSANAESLPLVGRGWDSIAIEVSGAEDVYQFALNGDGDLATLALTSSNSLPVKLELLGPAGEILATASPDANNVDQIIADFVAPADGPYYVRISGAEGADYSLVVTRNAQLSAEPHDRFETAQDITRTGVALGVAGYDMGRLFALLRQGNETVGKHGIIEIDLLTGDILNTIAEDISDITGVANTPATLLVASAADSAIYEMDPDDGSILRTIPVSGIVLGTLGFYGNEIFVGSRDGTYVLDYGTGVLKRTLDVGFVYGPKGTPKGMLGNDRRTVRLIEYFDPVTAESKSILPIGEYSGGVGIFGNELFIASTGDFELYVFDMETLDYTRTINVPPMYDMKFKDITGDVSFGLDWYSVAVNEGDTLTVETHTPAGGTGEFTNVVDPVIELYDGEGTLVAVADNNAADMRNAQLTYVAEQSGDYRIKVFAAGLGGEYILHVDGYTGSAVETFAVASIDPVDGEELTEVPKRVVVTFSDIVRQDSLDASDLKVDGVDAIGLEVIDGRTVVFGLSAMTVGGHVVTIDEGAILDLQGTPVEGFTSMFVLPVETEPVEPLGSLVYQQLVPGSITVPGSEALYSLQLDANQTLTIVVKPDAGLQPTVELTDPSGVVVATSSASAAGKDAVVQTIAVASAGVYHISFGGAAGSTGDFLGRIFLNTATESESHGQVANDTTDTAQDISDAFIDLGDGASRAAVQGQVGALYGENFETGRLGPAWSTYLSNETAIVEVTGERGNSFGDYSLLLSGQADQYHSSYSLSEAVWTVDLSSVSEATMNFWTVILNVKSGDYLYGDFTGHRNGTGVAISDDGFHWHTVWKPNFERDYIPYNFTIDLAAEAAAVGMTLGDDFQIKFQRYGDRSEGLTFDEIRILGPDSRDHYEFAMDAGQSATVALKVHNPNGEATVEILNASGTVLAAGRTAIASNVDELIAEFVAQEAGTYYVRVAGEGIGADYSLVITRGALFEAEPNSNNFGSPAQDITRTGLVLGETGAHSSAFFGVIGGDLPGLRVYEIDTNTGAKEVKADLPEELYWDRCVAAATEWSLLITNYYGSYNPICPIYEIEKDTWNIVRVLPNPGHRIADMAFLDNEIFVRRNPTYGDPHNQISVINYNTGELVRTLETDVTLGIIASSGGTLYTSVYNSETYHYMLYQIDPHTGQSVELGDIGSRTPTTIHGNEIISYDASEWKIFVFDLETFEQKGSYSGFREMAFAGGEGIVDDYYRVEVNAGNTLTITTTTPADGEWLFDNNLDPLVELYDPSGSLVAGDDDSAADGRNVQLEHIAAATGTYTLRVKATGGTSGEYVLHVSGHTGVASEPFTVVASDPADGDLFETRPTQMTVDFSDHVNFGTLEASDLTVDGAPATGYAIIDGDTVVFDLPPILAGVHNIAIAAGAATNIQATPVEAYAATITVGQFDFPVPLMPVEPQGSLVYHGSVGGAVDPAEDTNHYTLDIDAGQTITVVVKPDGLLQPVVHLYDSLDNLVAAANAGGPGEAATVQTFLVSQGGTYCFTVGGESGSTGGFTAHVLLNAAVENEPFDGPANNEMVSAQDLDGAFITLVGEADRAAVVGQITFDDSLTIAADDFETGSLGPEWSVYGSNEYAQTQVVERGDTPNGNFVLYQDSSRQNWDNYLSEAIWTVDLSGVVHPTLSFWLYWYQNDSWVELPDSFTEHFEGDGVSISDDGATWYSIMPVPAPYYHKGWMHFSIDLDTAAEQTGLSVGADFKIKFQRFGPGIYSGLTWDDIRITDAQDWYRFTLEAGEDATVALTPVGAAATKLMLYDESGLLVAQGGPGAGNTGQIIENFVAPTSGTYFVRVTATCPQDYSVVITRGAAFNLSMDDDFDHAVDISNTGAALAAVSIPAEQVSDEIEPNDNIEDSLFNEGATATDISGNFAEVSDGQYLANVQGFQGTRNGDVDIYRFLASPGDSFVAEFGGGDKPDTYLRILDRSGRIVAEASQPNRIEFSGFEYPGTYYIQMPAPHYSSNYSMNVTLMTNSPLWTQTTGYYLYGTDVGQTLIITTATSADGSGEFINELDPMVELYDPSGNLVATNDDGDEDGRNALLRYAARETGGYTIRVLATGNTYGEYVLNVETQEPSVTPLRVVSIDPPDGGVVDVSPTQIVVEFSHAVDTDTLDASDLIFDGTPTTGFTVTDPYTVTFDLPGLVTEGTYSVEIAAGTISHIYGQANEAFTSQFTFDAPAMVVVSTDPAEGVTVTVSPTEITVDFSQPLLVGTVEASDLLINGVEAGGFTIVDDDTVSFTVSGILQDGVYDVTIPAGAIGDIYGQVNEAFAGQFIFDAPAMVVTDIDPNDGSTVNTPPTEITVDFSQPLLVGTVEASDLLVNGAEADGFMIVDADTVVFSVSGILQDGVYDVTIPAGAIGDIYSQVNEAFASQFIFDVPAMVVVDIDPDDGSTVNTPPTEITVDFSQPLLVGTVEASDLLIDGSPADGFMIVDADTVVFSVSGILQDAVHYVTIPAGAIGDIYGQVNEAFTSRFTLEAPPKVTVTMTQSPSGIPGIDMFDFVLTIDEVGPEFTNAKLVVEMDSASIRDPDTSNTNGGMAVPVDTWVNTVFDYHFDTGTTVIFNDYDPVSPPPPYDTPPVALLDWSFYDTFAGDNSDYSPAHIARVLVDADAVGTAKMFVWTTMSGGIPIEFNFDIPEPATMVVVSTDPAEGVTVTVQPTEITVDFSQPIIVGTVEASDLLINGAEAGGFTIVDDDTVSFTVSGILQDGVCDITIQAGAIGNIYGHVNEAFAGQFIFDAPAMVVVSTDPAEGVTVTVQPTEITVDFSQPIIAGTVEASDLLINGAEAGGFTIVDDDTVSFTVSGILQDGACDITIQAGAIGDIYGQVNEAFAGQFIFDAPAMVVVSTDPAEGVTVTVQPTEITVNFSQPLLVGTVEASDLLINGAEAGGFTIVDDDTVSFTVSGILQDGACDITIQAGAIGDIYGHVNEAFAGQFIFDAPAMVVVSTDPAEGVTVTVPPTEITVDFSQPIIAGTVEASDLLVNGTEASGFTIVDDDTVSFTVSGILQDGACDVTIQAGAIGDIYGQVNEAFAGQFTLESPQKVTVTMTQSPSGIPGIDMFDFVLTIDEVGPEFTNAKLVVEMDSASIQDPDTSNTNGGMAVPVDTWVNTVFDYHFDTGTTVIHNDYDPVSPPPPYDTPPVALLDWSFYDTFAGDNSDYSPAHIARVLVNADAVGTAKMFVWTTTSGGVPAVFDFNIHEPTTSGTGVLGVGAASADEDIQSDQTVQTSDDGPDITGKDSAGTDDTDTTTVESADHQDPSPADNTGEETTASAYQSLPEDDPVIAAGDPGPNGSFDPLIPFDGTADVSTNTGSIGSDLNPIVFTFSLEAGQMLSAVARPVNSDATLNLRRVGFGEPTTAPAPGQPAVLQAAHIAVAGTYGIQVGSDTPTEFVLTVFRNVMIEAEDTRDRGEMSLDAGLVALAPGTDWFAVIGHSDPIVTIDEYTIDMTVLGPNVIDVGLKGFGSADMADIRIDLVGPDGTTVVSSSSAGSSGQDESVPDQVIRAAELLTRGIYTLRLTGRTRGDYVLIAKAMDTQPPVVTRVAINDRIDWGISDITPDGGGLETIEITFNDRVDFTADGVVLQAVSFPDGEETNGNVLTPVSVTGSGTNTMAITFENETAVETWVKVTLGSSLIADTASHALDGDSPSTGSGRGYLYDAALDLPTGEGTPGGDAVFYVGSLQADFDGNGQVNRDDLAIFLADYGAAHPGPGDLDGDDDCDRDDVAILLGAYGDQLDALPLQVTQEQSKAGSHFMASAQPKMDPPAASELMTYNQPASTPTTDKAEANISPSEPFDSPVASTSSDLSASRDLSIDTQARTAVGAMTGNVEATTPDPDGAFGENAITTVDIAVLDVDMVLTVSKGFNENIDTASEDAEAVLEAPNVRYPQIAIYYDLGTPIYSVWNPLGISQVRDPGENVDEDTSGGKPALDSVLDELDLLDLPGLKPLSTAW